MKECKLSPRLECRDDREISSYEVEMKLAH